MQRYGVPKTLLHDNAAEFCGGTFEHICKEKAIQQTRSPPYDHNKNPNERYIEIITSMMRTPLYISGLNPIEYWEHALPGTCSKHSNSICLAGTLYSI
jgi:hypothetical protein